MPSAFGWPTLGIGPTRGTEPPALTYPVLGAALARSANPRSAERG